MRERNRLERSISSYRAVENELNDSVGLIEMAEAENDKAMVADAEAALNGLRARAQAMKLESMLSGEADANDAYLEIHAGAGGTESQDWAEMLLRMYSRWAEKKGYKIEFLEESEGEEAGIKSATIQVKGENAYGWLKTETGVHRLVRISPFDSNATRSRSTFPTRTSASTSIAHRGPAASTSTRPNRRCVSPICRPALRCNARTTARSTRTALKPGICFGHGYTRPRCANARSRPPSTTRRNPTSAGGIRSDPMCCSPINW